ncbi:hypothetical protein MAPG_02162 [Magnaporthiopsis poae ATCC 64411]|uniref:Uncharacterized protein n=1 Tax=Magnaporthiopsis poae (strain ATCC 64411 / 73-15) TaxID=644358 RepID=A0A0C4DQL8_MAGP6|nr:hypothetical protein MAPG_02162 [Magnaporthiopsis poae ATCC 64411]
MHRCSQSHRRRKTKVMTIHLFCRRAPRQALQAPSAAKCRVTPRGRSAGLVQFLSFSCKSSVQSTPPLASQGHPMSLDLGLTSCVCERVRERDFFGSKDVLSRSLRFSRQSYHLIRSTPPPPHHHPSPVSKHPVCRNKDPSARESRRMHPMAGLVRKGDAPKTLFAANLKMLRLNLADCYFSTLAVTCFFSFSSYLAVNTDTGSKAPALISSGKKGWWVRGG